MATGKSRRTPDRGAIVALGLALGFAALYGWELYQRHSTYRTGTFDLGLLAQASWNTLRGRPFETSIMPVNYLAEHLSPVLVLLAPLFLLWDDVAVLLIVQAAAVGASGALVYAAARRWLEPSAALVVQAAYFLAPATGWAGLDEFHPISLAMPVVAGATALLWAGWPVAAVVVAGLSLLAKEEAVLWAAPFGLMVAVVGGRPGRLPGVLLAGLSVAWLAAYMFLVVPLVPSGGAGTATPHPNVGTFSSCGRTLGEVVRCLLDPAVLVGRATTEGDLAAMAALVGPTAGLALLGPSFVVSLGRWLVLLLGNDPPHYQAHYVALLAPALYLGAAETIGWVGRRRRTLGRALVGVLGGASVVAFAAQSPLPGGGGHKVASPEALARRPAVDRAVALARGDRTLSVVATSAIVPHLALRERIEILFDDAQPPDLRILDLRDAYPLTQDELKVRAAFFRADPDYEIVLDADDVLVMRRGAAPPQRDAQAAFGAFVKLWGYDVTPNQTEVEVRLYWDLLATADVPYHFFVHLVDRAGKGVGQQDGALVGGLLPATRWTPGMRVREQVRLPTPPGDLSDYRLNVGWYDLATGQRLKMPDGRDHVQLPLS